MEDPNKQQHRTFGKTLAALRLKEEVDKTANYRSAIRILNVYSTKVNEILKSNLENKKFFLHLVRKEFINSLEKCSADSIIKSLSQNVFVTKFRIVMKLIKDGNN